MMTYHSNGAFNFEQAYNMPVYLRTFYIKQLEETKKKEVEVVNNIKSKYTKKR